MQVSSLRSGIVVRLAAALALIGALVTASPFGSPAYAEETKPSAAVFDEAWRLVRDNFYDVIVIGLFWDIVC
jgi:hypothetical protein